MTTTHTDSAAAPAIVEEESLGGIAPIAYKTKEEVEAAKLMYGASYDRLRAKGHIVVPDDETAPPTRAKATAKKGAKKRSK